MFLCELLLWIQYKLGILEIHGEKDDDRYGDGSEPHSIFYFCRRHSKTRTSLHALSIDLPKQVSLGLKPYIVVTTGVYSSRQSSSVL